MEKDKLYLINKIFNDKKVRTVWNKESEKYYVSVVDVVGIISDSKNKQAYWRKLKQRLKEEGNERNLEKLKTYEELGINVIA